MGAGIASATVAPPVPESYYMNAAAMPLGRVRE
jgi:hypothetical protein